MSGDLGTDQRYAPWMGTYRSEGWNVTTTLRTRRVLLPLSPVVVAVGVWAVAQTIVTDGWGSLGLLVPQAAMLTWIVAWVSRPPQTRITPQGLVVRSQPFRTRTVGWGDVVQIRPPARFEEHPVALLTDGERVLLAGLPVVVAERMAEVTRVAPPPALSPTSSAVPDPDDDLDGPFRRGR